MLKAVGVVQDEIVKLSDPEGKFEAVYKGLSYIETAYKVHCKDYGLQFHRSCLNLYLQQFYESIIDLDDVIDKDEDTHAKYYLMRGRNYACLSMFKQAITDLSIAIIIDKNLIDAYLNRGKCAYLIGDTSLAFMDF